jgi:sulfhydrogenase subunit delta
VSPPGASGIVPAGAAPSGRGTIDHRPTLAVWKFASCDGCQLSLLDCEEELLALAGAVRIAHFTEMSRATVSGPYDVSLVEGSITTPDDARRIEEVRASSHRLVTIGACATAGGIQGLRNFAATGEYKQTVYAHPEYIDALETSTPISAHVDVDFELHGCPIDRRQLLEVVTAALVGRRPVIPGHSVCQECKGRGTVCLLVAEGRACLGPVTRAGCGALCPTVGRGCFGCFGPATTANTSSLAARLRSGGMAPVEVSRLFRTFNAGAPSFRDESAAQGGPVPVSFGGTLRRASPEGKQ